MFLLKFNSLKSFLTGLSMTILALLIFLPFSSNAQKNNKKPNILVIWGDDIGHFVRGRPIIESGKYPFEKMVSHKLPLERVQDAMNAISTNYRLDDKEVRKIVIAT